jgi:threonine aldolase
VETDECGAPEFFSNGTKVLLVPGENGKIAPDAIAHVVHKRTDLHFPKPRAVSLTNATEVGTTYTPAEVAVIGERAKSLGLRLHMDGARFANAVASLGCTPKSLTWQAGVDVLCFGGTKQGMPIGEAVVFFNRAMAEEFEWRCKQAGQLASKMRFLAASWVGMLRDGAWLRHAAHAKARATRLEAALQSVPGVKLLFPRQANAVFAELPLPAIQRLHERDWLFYTFIGAGGCRFMCSWDTQPEDVDAFAADIAAVSAA